jgi:hypothetical protein
MYVVVHIIVSHHLLKCECHVVVYIRAALDICMGLVEQGAEHCPINK